MTTLEIIDTVVKIGLGALISGVTTYIITHKSYKFELKKRLAQDKKEILMNVVDKVRASTSIKNKSVQSIFHKLKQNLNETNKKSIPIYEELQSITDAQNELGIAISYCYLLDLPKLAELIEEQFQLYGELLEHYGGHGIEYDIQFIEEITKNSITARSKMHEMYRTILSSTYN